MHVAAVHTHKSRHQVHVQKTHNIIIVLVRCMLLACVFVCALLLCTSVHCFLSTAIVLLQGLALTNSSGHTHMASTAPAMHPEVNDTTGFELFCGMAAGAGASGNLPEMTGTQIETSGKFVLMSVCLVCDQQQMRDNSRAP